MPLTVDMPWSERVALLERLEDSALLDECSRVLCLPPAGGRHASDAAEATVSARMTVGGHGFWLRVRLPTAFPRCLPKVALVKVEPPLELPHLLEDNLLCFTSDANLLDRRNPEAILRESLVLVRDHLRRMLEGDFAREFLREVVAYWRKLSGRNLIYCAVTASESPRLVAALYEGRQTQAVADDTATYTQSLPTRSARTLSRRNAVYLPLDPGAGNPSFRLRELATVEGLRQYVRALPETQRQALASCIKQCDPHEHFVVLGLKRPEGERALVGVLLREVRGGHPLTHEQAEAEVIPFSLLRRDRAFLAPRGGAGIDLRERRVLIAGCGSVGGYIALALARAGVGHLSLVDPDHFSLENTYRHACGMSWNGEAKVAGLKAEIERTIPYVSVESRQEEVDTLIRMQGPWVRGHDLVLAALGQPTTELDLNDWIWSNPEHPPALFTWLEPLGLGGHALLTHVRGHEGPARGCLQCLYERPYEGGAIENRAAFAESGVTYTRDTLGCGSRFLPFADLDAQRTAELATRLALRVLRREVHESSLRSWKGDRQAFERVGYSVTDRYDMTSGELDHIRADCQTCAR